jgi:hypothetical protein
MSDTLRLTNAYRYDGDLTVEIPYTDLTDLGGTVLINCPDGSSRMFSKSEVMAEPDK